MFFTYYKYKKNYAYKQEYNNKKKQSVNIFIGMKKILLLLLVLPIFANAQLLTEPDKQLHFAMGAAIQAGTYTIVYNKTKDKKKALLYSVGTAILAGTFKEIADSRQRSNRFDERDLLATTYGALSIGVTIQLFHK